MTQDTRKDRRVKIVSLNVRYKSATVDEFIENHAHDVSRGGIFIKTGNPFPPGTLLKFEIRLASDQAVIAGVGRIVWKRDAGASSGERPAGMGVKFIKIDEPSKVVIDRLMNTRVDAGKSFESGDEIAATPDNASARTVPPGPPGRSRTPMAGTVTAASVPPRASAPRSMSPAAGVPAGPKVAGTPALSSTAAGTPFARKATMMGLGVTSPLPPAPSNPPAAGSPPPRTPFPAAPSVPPRPGGGGGAMFPKSDSVRDMPPKEEQTVMRQAAELLEDALREAGGSMAEVGTNPLFSGTGTSPSAHGPQLQVPLTPGSEWTTAETPQALAATVAAIREEATEQEQSDKRDGTSPAPPGRGQNQKADSARSPHETSMSTRPAATQASELSIAPKKKGSGALAVVAVLAAGVAVGAFMFRDKLFGANAPPEPVAAPPTPTQTTPVVMASAPAVTPPPVAAVSAVPAASEAPAPTAQPATSAAAAPSAAASAPPSAETASAKVAPAAPPPPRPRPAVKPPPPSSAPSEVATAVGTSTAGAETATASPPPAESAPAPPPAKPAPPPKGGKPAKPSDDNPY